MPRRSTDDSPFAHLLKKEVAPSTLAGAGDGFYWKPAFADLISGGQEAPADATTQQSLGTPQEDLAVSADSSDGDFLDVVQLDLPADAAPPPVDVGTPPLEEEEDVFNRRHLSGPDTGRYLVLTGSDIIVVPTLDHKLSILDGLVPVAANVDPSKFLASNPSLVSALTADLPYGTKVRVASPVNIPADPETLIRACHVQGLV